MTTFGIRLSLKLLGLDKWRQRKVNSLNLFTNSVCLLSFFKRGLKAKSFGVSKVEPVT